MEQRIMLFRFHTPACIHGYSKPIYEHERSEKVDCRCPIYGRGHLRNEQKRIDNKTLADKGQPPITDWDVAFAIRERWLKQGNTAAANSNKQAVTDPVIGTGACFIEGNTDDDQSGIGFFIASKTATEVAGKSTMKKYKTLFLRRLIPWCVANEITHVKQLDDPATVQAFFNSWKNLRYALKPIEKNTKRAERERLSSFLNFWKEKRVLTANHAGPKAIRLGKEKVQPKIGFTEQELTRVGASGPWLM